MAVTYTSDLSGVDWAALRQTLVEDAFDNGRTPEQYRRSFENSARAILALDGGRVIGTARALSDGVCNAYVVDVWTHSAYRKQGIGRRMMELLVEDFWGQHVYLFTDEADSFYEKLGYTPRGRGYEIVRGQWLDPGPPETVSE